MRDVTEKLKVQRGALGTLLGSDADAKKVMTALRTHQRIARQLDGLAAKADAQVFGHEGLVPEARAAVVQLNAALTDARTSLKKVDAILEDAQVAAGNARNATAISPRCAPRSIPACAR